MEGIKHVVHIEWLSWNVQHFYISSRHFGMSDIKYAATPGFPRCIR